MSDKEFSFLYVTFPDAGEARHISRRLLEERCIACANIEPPVTSFYWWEGRIRETLETSVIFKTLSSTVEKTRARIIELHPYDTPCVAELEVVSVNEGYASWVRKMVQS